jgi:ABC-type nitrate/sulfonate/bicarbonate transport system substrate-binding protein
MKLAVPDLVSNSYFPAVAAVALKQFAAEGLEVELATIFPVDAAYHALRDHAVDFVGASAHGALAAFPEWSGVRLLCAQAQGMYWFLVMHADFGATRGDLAAVKGRRIGAAPWVDMGLRQMLAAAGIDIERDQVQIAPVPRSPGSGTNFGLNAARALEQRTIDGFWANGMAAEVAVSRGIGTVVVDARRGDGPAGAFDFTFSALAASERLVRDSPATAGAAVRAIAATHRALADNPDLVFDVAREVFPDADAGLLAAVIRRDLPFYDSSISPASVKALNRFARNAGILKSDVPFARVVATGATPTSPSA